MAFFAFGINHQTATVAIREQLALSGEKISHSLSSLLAHSTIHEALLLSTCNRHELYCFADDVAAPMGWLTQQRNLPEDVLKQHLYQYQDRGAVSHLMRVASGLDSMMLGEPQIFGQVKEAFELATQHGGVGLHMNRLMPHVFSTTKKVRTQTTIGQHPTSIAYAAVSLAKCVFSDLASLNVLVVGAGDTVELALQHFHEQGVRQVVVANRTLTHAEGLAKKYQGTSITLDKIPEHLPNTDVVLSATASFEPIILRPWVETALKSNRSRPIFLVDLAVPRDIEPSIGELDGAYLYNVDDLTMVTEKGLAKRREAAEQAEKIILQESDNYFAKLNESHASGAIEAYRNQAEQLRDDEVTKALRQLRSGKHPEEVVMALAHGLTNKLLHCPSVQMREASSRGKHEFMDVARRLLGINE